MGCTTSSPFKEYYLNRERKRRCSHCQCRYKNDSAPTMPFKDAYFVRGESESVTLPTDNRIPLTGRQIFLIKRSWKGISRNIRETGINMFLSLFEKNEEVLGYFQGLKSAKTLSELRTSKVLENHVKGVMLTIDEAITNLDDANTIIDMLLYVGKSHNRFQNFDPQVFWLLKDPFLLAVGDTLGDRYTAHVEDIYQKTIEFILSTVVAGFQSGTSPSTGGQNKTDDAKERGSDRETGPNTPKPGTSKGK